MKICNFSNKHCKSRWKITISNEKVKFCYEKSNFQWKIEFRSVSLRHSRCCSALPVSTKPQSCKLVSRACQCAAALLENECSNRLIREIKMVWRLKMVIGIHNASRPRLLTTIKKSKKRKMKIENGTLRALEIPSYGFPKWDTWCSGYLSGEGLRARAGGRGGRRRGGGGQWEPSGKQIVNK